VIAKPLNFSDHRLESVLEVIIRVQLEYFLWGK